MVYKILIFIFFFLYLSTNISGEEIKNPGVKKCIQVFESGTSEEKNYAAQFLSALRDISCIPFLIKELKNKNSETRKYAVLVLGRVGNKSVVPSLIEMLKDENEDEDIKLTTIVALGNICDKSALSILIEFLKSKNKYFREYACWALGAIGDKSAIPFLVGALKDEDEYVRSRAVESLGKINEKSTLPLLTETLKDKSGYVRLTTVLVLSEIGDSSVIPVLTEILNDKDSGVKKYIIKTLGKIGKSSVVPLFIKLLKSGKLEFQDRDEVITTLGEIGPEAKGAVPVLIGLLNNEDDEYAVDALGKIGDHSAIPVLIKKLKSWNWRVQAKAAEALGKIGPDAKDAIPALIEILLNDKSNYQVKISVFKSFGKLQDKSVVPALIKALKNKEYLYCGRSEIIWALGEIGDPSAITPLIEIIKAGVNTTEEVEALCKLDKPTFLFLKEILKSKNEEIAYLVTYFLREIGDMSTIPLFIDLLRAKDESMRREAAMALGYLGGESEIEHLSYIAQNDESENVREKAILAIEAIKSIKKRPRKVIVKMPVVLRWKPVIESKFEEWQWHNYIVRKGEILRVYGKAGDWYFVESEIRGGYILSDWVTEYLNE